MPDSPVLIANTSLLTAVSMASNQTSVVFDASSARQFAVQSVWSGTSPVGTMNVSASLDGVNFKSLYSLAVTGNTGIDVKELGYLASPYIQVSYTFTSGTGTLTVKLSAKQ